MTLVLQPQNSFTVVRQISNHLDTATYYVRAVIRNAYTDAVIETLDLEDKGSQRFKKNWQVPGDTSGQGFYISIVTSVYSDSGYTTKSENYGDDENTYLVQDRIITGRFGGGDSTDYTRIREIVKEEVDKIEIPEPKDFPEMPVMKWGEVMDMLQQINIGIASVPKEQVDLIPALNSVMETIKQLVEDKEVTPETDINPIIEKLDGISSSIDNVVKNISQSEDGVLSKISEDFNKLGRELKKTMAETTFSVAPMNAKANPREKPEQSVPFNIKDLSI